MIHQIGIYPNREIRENFLKATEFRYPEWIPCSVNFLPAVWKKHRKKLEDIVVSHPLLFGEYERGRKSFDDLPNMYRGNEYFRDNWGCLWYNIQEGLAGRILDHPLSDWKALETYSPPDFLTKTEIGERDWTIIKKSSDERRREGLLVWGDGERLFDRLYFLRGFKNLMIDIASGDPHLHRLISMLLEYEMKLVNKWIEVGVDIISFHTDIGTQRGLMINPESFRKYIKPMFKKLFRSCINAGVHVYLSSDGRLLDIVEDLIECGVSIHDPQLRANTLKGIESHYKGNMCIDLDLDRQMFPYCRPVEIRKQVKDAVKKLHIPEGGLMIKAEMSPDVPLENIKATCRALEAFCIREK